jgi:hypothetical protein
MYQVNCRSTAPAGTVVVGGEKLYDGLEVDGLVLAIDGSELGASVLEELLALSGGDEVHVFGSVGRTAAVRSPNRRTAQGPPGVEGSIIDIRSGTDRKAPAVTADSRWRGRCVKLHQSLSNCLEVSLQMR